MKLAILELGTNTFHLLIVDVKQDKSYTKIFKSKVIVKLGEGAIQKNFIAAIPFERGIKALKHYSQIIFEHKPEGIFAFATSAIRSATNGKEFVKSVLAETGIKIKVISGEKKAELICYGVRQCVRMTKKKQLIMDIGGGSTEFVIANKNETFWKGSFNIGASRLLEIFKPSDPITSTEIKKMELFLEKIVSPLNLTLKKYPVDSLIGSSGSFDTLAEIIGWKFRKRDVLKNVSALQFDLPEYF